ncbi:transposase [Hydrocoleum sp. CS-953]|uniref:RNA-guided endonuclease InsQ/TnpB family protein n=1 Tax=Hydrocoleum sp. CS-953 TaxID=1671698 RepID=UPI000B9A6C1C|nr:RNA-guided endonuclease TnpB family protein [Hydrocoleum sp. CS-953]OZH53812.1 transposase [Hydrocoleum sp. CS-953]
MRLVEKHIIKESHQHWKEIDKLCFLSKNLYNYANYLVRQSWIFNQTYLNCNQIYNQVKNSPDYRALPSKVSQQILRILDKNWQSFFAASQAHKENPNKFIGRPKLPKYKDKIKGRNLLVYTIQAISKLSLTQGKIKLSKTEIEFPTQAENIACVRVIPKLKQYVIEVVYERPSKSKINNPKAVAAIDIGVDNLAALTSNQKGFTPILVNGRVLKSINQFYNKTRAKLQSKLQEELSTSNQIQRLTAKRNNQVENYLHVCSRWIINHLQTWGIGQLIIGKNPLWKQWVNNTKTNNQSFVNIPHARFVEMLKYKGEMAGIKVIVSEESYTSRASFLSLDYIPRYGEENGEKYEFSGYRESRGMYKQKDSKIRINADVNGSYNIMRKVIPTIFDEGIEGVVVRPVRITPNQAKN